MRSKTSVHYWRYNNGEPGNLFEGSSTPRGWYCWVYPENDGEFQEWMEQMCPGADIAHRFNNGNPMWTVYIASEREATVFALKWVNE